MVGDALEVTDDFQKLCCLMAILGTDLFGTEFHQIGAQLVFIMVCFLLRGTDFFRRFRRIVGEYGEGVFQCAYGAHGHIRGYFTAACQSDRRSGKQSFVQLRFGLRLLGVRHQAAHQFFQHAGKGQHQQRTEHIEGRVCNGNAQQRGRCIQQQRIENRLDQAEHRQPYGRTDQVKAEVYQRGALGVFIGAHRGENGGNTGADVLTHDDGDGCAVADLPGNSQRLQDTHRGRAGLDDRREDGACQHTQNGVFEQQE